MSSATFTPASLSAPKIPGPRPAPGATALSDTHRPHRVGATLRAAKVFMTAAFGVAVLGEYAEEAGVRRR
ncbi:hypothetical protein [Streptomyces sp. NPDC127108]|uniref:hypothetical protein n=1 Tax=Streptomyces sp. NPDC127108 TaxID=3345361 RepID=UPI0036300988